MCLSGAVACSLWLSAPSVCRRVELKAEMYPGLVFVSCTSWDRNEWGGG